MVYVTARLSSVGRVENGHFWMTLSPLKMEHQPVKSARPALLHQNKNAAGSFPGAPYFPAHIGILKS